MSRLTSTAECAAFAYPSNLAAPLQIAIEASDGASDYGNKFGEPVVQGFARSFGMRLANGERREWVKPIMCVSLLSGISALSLRSLCALYALCLSTLARCMCECVLHTSCRVVISRVLRGIHAFNESLKDWRIIAVTCTLACPHLYRRPRFPICDPSPPPARTQVLWRHRADGRTSPNQGRGRGRHATRQDWRSGLSHRYGTRTEFAEYFRHCVFTMAFYQCSSRRCFCLRATFANKAYYLDTFSPLWF